MFNSSIPQRRLLLYIVLFGFIPSLFLFAHFWQREAYIEQLLERVEEIKEKGKRRELLQLPNRAVLERYENADNLYVDRHLEKIALLQEEIQALQKILDNKDFADEEQLHKRLKFLLEENRLTFNEGAVVRYPEFKEVVETQTHPVELDGKDIKTLFTLVEGIVIGGKEPPPGRPQMMFLDFKLERKKERTDREFFSLNSRILKREFSR